MGRKLTTIGFDADDTLWHNEKFFQLTQRWFADLLSDYVAPEFLMQRLLEAEHRNLGHYGFGIKGFTLSMIETALDVTDQRVSSAVISEIVEAGREMLRHPVELLPHAQEAIEMARQDHRVILITKGDLLDQERKLMQSGLRDMFNAVEIVSDKTPAVYYRIFSQFGEDPDRGLMIGNSLRSDVLPMLEIGGWGVHVPHEVEWAYEQAVKPTDHARFKSLQTLAGLEDLLSHL